MKKFVRLLYFFADVRQAAIFFVHVDVVRVNGHDDAGQPVAGEAAHIVVVPQAAVGANHRMNAALGRVAIHRAQIAMHHRFPADKKQIADMIFHRDVHDLFRFVQRHAAPRLRIKLGAGESTETAIGVANVGDGELQIAGAAVIQYFADELERSFFWPDDRFGQINFRLWQRFYICRRRIFENRIIVH